MNDGFKPIEIVKSSADLRKYKTHQFSFDIIVEGGTYLEDLIRDLAYNVGLTFYVSIRKENGEILEEVYSGDTYYSVGMQIHNPLGGTPPKPAFAFEVNADASLNFISPEHYTQRVQSNPDNSWLKVTSKGNYVVTVQTNADNFQVNRLDASYEGNTNIEVGVVKMEVEDRANNKKGSEAALSPTERTVFTGIGKRKGSDILNVRYFISKDKARELAAKSPGQYSTTLTYTLAPQ